MSKTKDVSSRKTVWEAKEKKSEEFAQELVTERGNKTFFKIAKHMVKERQDVEGIQCMKDELGNIKFGNDVKGIWRKYMEKLMNEENDWDGDVECNPIQGPRGLLTEEEFKAALAQCASGKAAGPSCIATEMADWLVAAGSAAASTPATRRPNLRARARNGVRTRRRAAVVRRGSAHG